MLQFIQISVQMFHRQSMIRPDHRALKQAPNILDRVGVNIAANPLLFRMINKLVARVRVAYAAITDKIIGVDRFGLVVHVFCQKLFHLKAIRAFYRQYLRGAKEIQPRWKRCVEYVDEDLGEALGQVYVRKTFSPETKAETVDMTRRIEDAMGVRIQQLTWMSSATKQQALGKLHSIRNKVGYPDKWRDYSSVNVVADDFYGNQIRATEFEAHREINKIGKPVDRTEWDMTPPTVNAYYNPQMNDINFPAGVLQPPLYDPKMDDAPNYGDTGSTIGHELTHGFDDEGRQYNAKGDLKDWWTKQDADEFVKRSDCVVDQYGQYVVVDDVRINSKLTEGEDVADLGGTILAYIAWKDATKDKQLHPVDDLTPDQRFFIGFAQWACENDRPENARVRAVTDPHSPAKYRVNGVVVNVPEFGTAFGCKPGSPMVKPSDKVCRVW